MLRRSIFWSALAAGLASITGPVARLALRESAAPNRLSMPHRGSGKGKGRAGARKPAYVLHDHRRDSGKNARRRRRACKLRRG